jgi:hypothetical protein
MRQILTSAITKMYQSGLMKVDQIGKGEKLRPEEQVRCGREMLEASCVVQNPQCEWGANR